MKFLSESLAVKAFIKAMPAIWHIQKIETSMAAGVPDLHIAIPDSQEFWLEVKNGDSAEVRPMQFGWWARRVKAGGKVWLVWFHKDGWELHKIDDNFIRELNWKPKGLRLDQMKPFAEGESWTFLQQRLTNFS